MLKDYVDLSTVESITVSNWMDFIGRADDHDLAALFAWFARNLTYHVGWGQDWKSDSVEQQLKFPKLPTLVSEMESFLNQQAKAYWKFEQERSEIERKANLEDVS